MAKMIECLPTGVCSWNYRLRGAKHQATVGFTWANESGALEVDGVGMTVEKQGFFSGRWNLRKGARVIAHAEKLNAFQRKFELVRGRDRYALSACSMGSRRMEMSGPGSRVVIEPHHCFTRRATIEGTLPDFEMVCFGFWLTALTWRRATNNAGAA